MEWEKVWTCCILNHRHRYLERASHKVRPNLHGLYWREEACWLLACLVWYWYWFLCCRGFMRVLSTAPRTDTRARSDFIRKEGKGLSWGRTMSSWETTRAIRDLGDVKEANANGNQLDAWVGESWGSSNTQRV
eukprot:scaffold4796_cov264-Amphora_coffeaeformis.AAC.3